MEFKGCAPFKDGVPHICLSFPYHPLATETLKDALRPYWGMLPNKRSPGGWLSKKGYWFVAREVWPDVRERLESEGYTLKDVNSYD
jgi:hypothetical protein